MKNRIKEVLKLTLGYAIVAIVMWCLNLITFEIGTAIFFYFLGAFSYAISEKKSTKQEDNEKQSKDKRAQSDKKENSKGGFHRNELRPSVNCCNSNTYGVICVRCGRCGRKF